MEETVKTPGKSMEYDYFLNEFLPKIKNAPIINFMGGEPTLHPQFIDIFQNTYDDILPFSHLSVFTNGLMPEKVLNLLLKVASPSGAISKNITFAILLNWQTMENISEKNHARCQEVAERMLRVNGYSVTFSINLYSKDQDLERQCEEIDRVYQKAGLPNGKQYKIRVSPAFPHYRRRGQHLSAYSGLPKSRQENAGRHGAISATVFSFRLLPTPLFSG